MRNIRVSTTLIVCAVLSLAFVLMSDALTMSKPMYHYDIQRGFNLNINHPGIDLSPIDSSWPWIFAVADGVVVGRRTGSYRFDTGSHGTGNHIVIEHAEKFWTKYYHLKYVFVQNGQAVRRNDLIGYVGNTGNTIGPTGIHLHFGIFKNSRHGDPVDPEDLINFGAAAPRKNLKSKAVIWAEIKSR